MGYDGEQDRSPEPPATPLRRAPMNIVNVGYDSTNYYVLGAGGAYLLVDCGWPGTLPKIEATLKRKDIPLGAIRHLLVTHYHPDHAGLAQELKERGVRLIVLESQRPAIPLLKTLMKRERRYHDIALHDNIDLRCGDSRAFLRGLGIAGDIISTPGHSDDSVTLVLDAGAAFTGDLPSPPRLEDAGSAVVAASWARLRALGVARVYPGHGPTRPPPRG